MDSTVRNFRTVQIEGSRQVERDLDFYNLDAIISVGYRVNFYQATQFRIWAITGKTAAEIIYSAADATKIYTCGERSRIHGINHLETGTGRENIKI